ncbi:hypothetical protein BCT82_03695 [Vibrio breoganii]|nr:hypothetical protein BCT82_03695 [Vibrio breoganii]
MRKALNIRVFKHKILIDALTESELHSLTKDFRRYKETGADVMFSFTEVRQSIGWVGYSLKTKRG